ncbi:MAG: site-specific integrase [Geminicoccaceae bacterium]
MPTITAKLVAAVEPEERDVFIWDSSLKGFGLRVYPSGTRRFILQWKVDSRTRRLVLGTFPLMKVDAARGKALDALARIERGEDPAAERDQRKADITLSEFLERYLAEGAGHLKPKSIDAYQSVFRRHVMPMLGARKLRTLRPSDIEALIDDVAIGRTARTVEGDAKKRGRIVVRGGRGVASKIGPYLGSAFSWAIRRGWLDNNPCAGVKKIKTRSAERYLSTEEFARLGAALAALEAEGANPFFVAVIRLLALTGCRKGEIAGLTWSQVDLDANVLRLTDSKTGARIVPLSPPAVAVLAGLPRTERPHAFPSSRSTGPVVGLRKFWITLCQQAKIEGATLHTLRHSLASTAVMGGASLYLVGKALGHTQAATTERYSHVALDPVRAVVGAAAEAIDQAMRGGKAAAAPIVVALPQTKTRR